MTSRFATLSGKKLTCPREALKWANHNSTPETFWLKANSLTCPIGREPGSAFVLLTRRDLAALDVNGLHTLAWNDSGAATTFVDLVIMPPANCMSLSLSDPDSLYLVELRDKRQQLKISAINEQYNVRVPAGPRQTTEEYYYPESLNGGSLWTWQTLFDSVWSNLPTIAGASPTLPYTPSGSPEGFRFIGVNAWDAYNTLAAKIGCEIKLNPITGVLSLVRRGQTQAGLAAAQAALAGRRVYDYDPINNGRADSPETIRVFFHKRAEGGHGSEKDTPREDNWEMSPAHSEDVASGITGAEAGTVLPVWDDLPALVDKAGSLTNSSALATRAAEVAANIAARFDVDFDRIHYGGCQTSILPGEQVSKVVWRDYADGYDNAAGGLVTEVHLYPLDEPGAGCCHDENLAGPDLARHSHPVYPDLAQKVVVYHSSASFGEFVEANDDGLHPGYIVRVNADQTTEYLERIWILFTDNFEEWAGDVLAVQEWQYGPARLSGDTTSDGETYPLYRVQHGDRTWPAVNQAEMTQGEPVDVEIWTWDNDALLWGETGIVWPAQDWFLNDADTVPAGTKMLVKWHGPILVVTAAYCSESDDPYVIASLE